MDGWRRMQYHRAPAGTCQPRMPAHAVEYRALVPKASVAQLDRVLPSEGRGRTFESCRMRQKIKDLRQVAGLFHVKTGFLLQCCRTRRHILFSRENRRGFHSQTWPVPSPDPPQKLPNPAARLRVQTERRIVGHCNRGGNSSGAGYLLTAPKQSEPPPAKPWIATCAK